MLRGPLRSLDHGADIVNLEMGPVGRLPSRTLDHVPLAHTGGVTAITSPRPTVAPVGRCGWLALLAAVLFFATVLGAELYMVSQTPTAGAKLGTTQTGRFGLGLTSLHSTQPQPQPQPRPQH